MPELPELRTKRPAKKLAVRGVQCAVTQPVVRAFKGNHAAFAGGEYGGLERGLNGFKS